MRNLMIATVCLCVGMPDCAYAADKRAVKKYEKQLASDRALEGHKAVGDLYVVDCLLPGKVRRLGNTTYLGPRRPIKTTAADCRIKGGEYTEYDRADYRSALNVWMAAAEAGDAQAQTHVGEIFERGLGGEPNYQAALIWYLKAARQGNPRAQFALGTLYEQGLGVARDQLQALNWYRTAWGMPEDSIVFSAAARREREEQARAMQAQIEAKDTQIQALSAELAKLRKALEDATVVSDDAQARINTLQTIVDDLEKQRQAQRTELSSLLTRIAPSPTEAEGDDELRLREPAQSDAQSTAQVKGETRHYKNLSLGGYYALLIGNAEYERMQNLVTPLNDVARARQILEQRYGFTVFTLDNGDSTEVMQAINNLNDLLTEDDNLLLFFAGHGSRLQTGNMEVGYWLPKNAERPPRNTFWVSNEFVSGHLARLRARRILVVADSCYAGLLANEPSLALMGVDAPQYQNLDFLEFKLSKRSRLLLSSGGDRPVLDQGPGGHSVFANAFLTALEENQGLLSSPDLFRQVRARVKKNAGDYDFEQAPELKSIKSAGHEVGDFFFLAKEETKEET